MGEHLGDIDLPLRIRNDNKWLQSKKLLVLAGEGEHTWNALYQGHPSAQEGNLFKESWWQSYDRSTMSFANFDYSLLSVDASFKKTETSDMVAMEIWGIKENNIYLWKLINKRMGFVETTRRIKELCKEFPTLDNLIIEDKANGSAIIDSLHYIEGIPTVIGVNPLGSKYSRAQAVSPFVSTGCVYIPTDFTEQEALDVEWDGNEKLSVRGKFITQHSRFPFMKHDDMVDAETQALARMIKLITGEEPIPAKKIVRYVKWYPDMWEDFENMTPYEQEKFINTYGAPLEWRDI